MSRSSQKKPEIDSLPVVKLPPEDKLEVNRAIVTISENFRHAGITKPHTHPRGQFLYAAHGTLVTTANDRSWVAPPERAIWIPAGILHVTRHGTGTELRSVFIRSNEASALPRSVTVMQMSALARELFLAVMKLPRLYDEGGAEGRLVGVLLDQLTVLPEEGLYLPLPVSRRLRVVALRHARHKGSKASLREGASAALMTPRTFARHFRLECGMSYGAWQRQACLLRAVELLGAGQSVGDVAFALGYESTSAFIAMFRRAFGTTPANYFRP